MIYCSELYAKWIFMQKKKKKTTCCVYAMCTSALVNGCEWFIQYNFVYNTNLFEVCGENV